MIANISGYAVNWSLVLSGLKGVKFLHERDDPMKRRLGLWALLGLAIAGCWFLVSLMLPPQYMYSLGHSSLVAITAPASLLGRAMPLKFYWFILLNGVAYAMLGLTAELFLRALIRTAWIRKPRVT